MAAGEDWGSIDKVAREDSDGPRMAYFSVMVWISLWRFGSDGMGEGLEWEFGLLFDNLHAT